MCSPPPTQAASAAPRTGIKQSMLSKRVQYLEESLGLTIFRRSTRGVLPTDPGERFVAGARRILDDVDALADEARALARGERGTLRLGFNGSLERDQIDLAIFAGQCARPGIVALALSSEPVLLAVGDPLAARDRIYWTDLRRSAFVVSADPGPDLADMTVSRLSGPGHRPAIVRQEVSQANLRVLAGGAAIAVVAGVQSQAAPPSGIALRHVHDVFGATMLEQGEHWRRDDDRPVLLHFLDLIAARHGYTLPRPS